MGYIPMPKKGYGFCLIPAHGRAERRPGGVLETESAKTNLRAALTTGEWK